MARIYSWRSPDDTDSTLASAGILLTGYLAAGAAIPAVVLNHAIKKRNAWPVALLIAPIILITQVASLRAIYM